MRRPYQWAPIFLTFPALNPGIPEESLRARAHRLVGLHLAEGVNAAGVSHHARVPAEAVEAGLVLGALVVGGAAGGQGGLVVDGDWKGTRGAACREEQGAVQMCMGRFR